MKKTDFKEEEKKLSQTIEIIDLLLKEERDDLNKLIDNFVGRIEDLWRETDIRKVHIRNLIDSLEKPYFARIDFQDDYDNQNRVVYIGKNGINQDANIVVTDWRAPISSLYYDSNIGKCSYEAPDGDITGDLKLKRQFDIDGGRLIDYFDVDLVANDDLLQKYLNSNNDSRLKNIVSTIQKEQNDVIRKKLGNNIIVQGVAGSGKTTVALHRIAYLIYNYIDSIKQNQHLVIGPNPLFLKYTQSVLPELDVSGVRQNTYEEFAKKYIGEDINVNSSENKIVNNINGKKVSDIDKFKCSIKYQQMLELFLKIYFNSVTSKPLMLGDFEVLSKRVITDIFQSTSGGYSNNLNSRIENTIDRICDYIEKHKSSISSKYSYYSYQVFKTAETDEEKNKLRSKFSKERNEINRNCRTTLRKYFNKSKVDATKLYKLFINTIEDFDIFNYENLDTLKSATLKNTKRKCYDYEDLAALIYIESVISPKREFEQIRHVTIDEAQDLGEFNFYSLQQALPRATFSIYGDLAQSIYDYRSIDDWKEVNKVMFNDSADIIKFNKSYRTTAEIMNAADDVAESINLDRSDLVVRHGPNIELSSFDNTKNIPSYIVEKIYEYKKNGYKTIAVISKTDDLSKDINDDLRKIGLEIPNISIEDDLNDEKFSICTISNFLAKGLEFDAVIINNANENIYSSEDVLDMKLLYVAITRALHELDVTYSGPLTKPLRKQLAKKKM